MQQYNFCTCSFFFLGRSKNGTVFTHKPRKLPNILFEPHCVPTPTMGKKRSKAQNGAKPVFDEAALSNLTAKIDTDLTNPKPKSNSKYQKQKDERPAKRKRSENDVKDATPNKRQAQEPKSRPAKTPKENKTPKDKKAELLQEILALGGDENDLDIIAGVDSDVEEGQEAKPKEAPSEMDKSLKNELAKFAAGLGFEKVRDEDAATDDADDDEEEVEESEAADEEEEEEWEDEAEPEQDTKEPAVEKQSRSAAGKLVSMRRLGQTCHLITLN